MLKIISSIVTKKSTLLNFGNFSKSGIAHSYPKGI